MSGWQAGDLAVCVTDAYQARTGDNPWWPVLRGTYRVAGVDVVENGAFLEFEEDPEKFDPDAGWKAADFRKILPADPAFAERMRSLKPRVDA